MEYQAQQGTISSLVTILVQGPENGIIDHGKSDVRHNDQFNVLLEYLDFYRPKESTDDTKFKCLVFDRKFTNCENRSHMDDMDVRFLTING